MSSATTKLVAVILAALTGSVPVGACGDDRSASGTGARPAPPKASSAIHLLGERDAVATATRLMTGFETRVNATPGADDPVLFTVSAVDGPMPQTLEQVRALRGRSYGPAAILLVKTDEADDAEIRALVVQEMRELLRANDLPRALEMPVIVGEDPNLDLTLRGLSR